MRRPAYAAAPATGSARRRRSRRRGRGAARAAPAARRRSSPAAGRRTRAPRSTGEHRLVDRVAVVGRQVEHAGRDRGDGPGDPDHGRRPRRRRPGRRRGGASMSATQAATSAAVGGSERQVPLVQPDRADVHRVRGRRAPVATPEDQLGRAAADVDHQHGQSPAASRRLRTAPSKDSAASSSPDSTSGATPSRARTPAAKTVGVRRVAGGRGGAEADPGRRRARRSARRTRRSPRTCGPAPRRPAGRSRRRPGRAGRSGSRGPRRRAARR